VSSLSATMIGQPLGDEWVGMVEGSLSIPRADGGFSFRERGKNGGAMHTGSISCIPRGSVLLASFCINFWS
jgi:hypothetical protein